MNLRVYVALLVPSMLTTILPDVLEPLSPGIAFLKVVWIPASLYISFRLLCRVIKQIPMEQLLPLSDPGLERRTPERLEHYIILITYCHAWLLLGRLLDVIHPVGFLQVAVMMAYYTSVTTVAFGKCLLIAGIDQSYWGHFFNLYILNELLLRIFMRVSAKFITLFS
ncbi:hypothetical protein BDP27DRAFT_1321229 [Rhodocollybia butyracea]|uniref:Uncharacterized protein n=1 Tax=Rhodocollybia butyracea TaxID=206335 RepID=A0A9P5PTC8_9AGAR|nr:hypothetical protein BDP27DRAFT_1321229 [Rhodocollybia butyracea]